MTETLSYAHFEPVNINVWNFKNLYPYIHTHRLWLVRHDDYISNPRYRGNKAILGTFWVTSYLSLKLTFHDNYHDLCHKAVIHD
jgi:hypothetical protein